MKHLTATIAAGLIAAAAAFAPGSAVGAGQARAQGLGRASGRLSDRAGGRGHGQETFRRDQRAGSSVAMYPSMQLGGEKEAIEQAQVGAIAFARVSVGALGPVVDDLNVFNLPYVFRNTEHMQQVIDGPIGQELLDKVTNSGKGLVGLCWMDAGARNFYDTKKPIKTLADLKGLKFRVMGNPMFVDMANSMGANGVPHGLRPGVQRRCRPAWSTAPRTIRRASCSTTTIRWRSSTRSTST